MTNKKPLHLNIPTVDKKKSELCRISGSANKDVTQVLAKQIANALWFNDRRDGETTKEQMSAVMSQMLAFHPADELESMLGAQMVIAHNAAMDCFRRAMLPEQSVYGRELNLKYADKLTRTYATLLSTLDKHRGKGQQKVTVEHVHISDGGKAIIGDIKQSQGGG